MTPSDALAHFGSKAYEDFKKGRENEFKLQHAIIEHLAVLIKVTGRRRF
ncbi:hypothetical protein [Pseudomonas sp.]